jgi:hypothetical protein
MVSRPNVGICRYLDHLASASNPANNKQYVPKINLINQSFIFGTKNTYQVYEQAFPNAKLKFVQKIDS